MTQNTAVNGKRKNQPGAEAAKANSAKADIVEARTNEARTEEARTNEARTAEAKKTEAKKTEAKKNDKTPDKKKSGWKWSLGLVATGVAGAAVVAFRGCWHRKMSWPVRAQDVSYQVCLSCGIKRLFDEKDFRSYGPYSYDLEHLTNLRRAQVEAPAPAAETARHRSAS